MGQTAWLDDLCDAIHLRGIGQRLISSPWTAPMVAQALPARLDGQHGTADCLQSAAGPSKTQLPSGFAIGSNYGRGKNG